jgi:hypothetical protein
MKRTWLTPAFIAGLLVMYLALYLWQPGGSEVLLILTHASFAASALLASILTLKASRMFEPGVASRHVWLFFGAGMTVLTISEILWILYYVLSQPISYPSAIDVSWAIGFIPILVSLVLQYRALNVQLSRRRKLLVLAAYLGVLFVMLALLLESILSHPGEVAVIQLLVGAYYLVGSLGVAFIATLSLMFLGGGLVARPWVYMVISILLFAIAGLAFSYGTWTSTFVTGGNFLSAVSDVSYLAGYLLAAAGGYTQLTLHLYSVRRIIAFQPHADSSIFLSDLHGKTTTNWE